MGGDKMNRKYITHSRIPFFQIALDFIKENNRVLDIGPGSGEFSKFCDRDDFYLLEGNSETVELLKNKYKNVYKCFLPVIPFENAFFDVIHCSHVIEHLQAQDLYDTLVNIDKALKIGGYLIIYTPLDWPGFYDDLSPVRPSSPLVI